MSNKESIRYFDSQFDDFYKGLDTKAINTKPGYLCWAPVCFLTQELKVWRPDYRDEDQWGFASADYFTVVNNPTNLFNHGKPLKAPEELKSKEEFLLTRAKLRPVIILFCRDKNISFQEVRKGHRLNRDIVTVIPLFSIYDKKAEKFKFSNDTILRTRLLVYPNLMFLPESDIYGIENSIVRLDYVFSIYPNLLKPMNIKLSDDVFMILNEMFEALIFKGVREGSYLEVYKSDMEEFIPKDNKNQK